MQNLRQERCCYMKRCCHWCCCHVEFSLEDQHEDTPPQKLHKSRRAAQIRLQTTSRQTLHTGPLHCRYKLFVRMRVLLCSFLLLLGEDALLACSLKNYTLYVEKHECGHCMAINTTVCSGMCFTRDTNVQGFVGKRFLLQQSCMHRSLVYRSARMPGCPVHIDPLFFYPVARRCNCTKCNTSRNECVFRHKHKHNRCSKQLRTV
ncbi:thyrotropin subunit beta [Danio rerio]|uniref:Thyrotropin subunit beta n=1 Tax=Danio rerio TaxID=7955 RepID=A0AC58IND7_DANRE